MIVRNKREASCERQMSERISAKPGFLSPDDEMWLMYEKVSGTWQWSFWLVNGILKNDLHGPI
jgi:hypothetical protein